MRSWRDVRAPILLCCTACALIEWIYVDSRAVPLTFATALLFWFGSALTRPSLCCFRGLFGY